MKKEEAQYSAREAWNWLWYWVKENKRKEYKEKYIGTMLAERIDCNASAISLWKSGKMSFEEDKLKKVRKILDEWVAMLPKEGWRSPYTYIDKDYVHHLLDYNECADQANYVQCNFKCKGCKKLTPTEGQYCMHCGKKKRVIKELK